MSIARSLSRLTVVALILTRLRAQPEAPGDPATPAGNPSPKSEPTHGAASLQAYVGLASVGLAVIAAVLYLFLRFAYLQFYGIFGLTPEQVGLGRIELLSQALTGPLVLILLQLRWFLLVVLVALILAAMFKWKDVAVTTLASSVATILVMTGVTGVAMVNDAVDLAHDVVDKGTSVEQRLRYVGELNVPTLQVRAQTVAVEWLDERLPQVLKTRPECLLFLGQSSDQVHLYNVHSKATATLPRNKVVLNLRFASTSVPEDCRPAVTRG